MSSDPTSPPDERDRDAVDALVAEIGHELTTPLVLARGFVGDIVNHDDLPEDVQEAARSVTRNITVALQLLANYADAARDENDTLTLELEWLEVGAFARDVVADLAPLTDSHEVEVDVPDDELRVLADPNRLRQTLFNLISNAVRHTAHGTTITVRVGSDGDEVHVDVADEGGGVEPAMADRIFEHRTRGGSGDGLGIGLYVSRRIAEAHGGSLELVPSAGGATFRLTLPLEH